jgi:hypothetical protein
MNRRNGRQIASEERRARHFAPFPYRRMVDGNILYRLVKSKAFASHKGSFAQRLSSKSSE